MRIGIDFGGVIVKPADGDNPFDAELGLKIEQPNSISTIKTLINSLGAEVWIISKASKATQNETRKWLNFVRFYQKTGFSPSNLVFCGKRSEKEGICSNLEIQYFVDDSKEVLDYMNVVPNLYLFGGLSYGNNITGINDWSAFLEAIKG